MTTEYILSQVFVAICYVLLGITYFVKNRKLILVYSFASIIANAIAFFLLGAWSALAMCGVAILRNIIFLIQNHKEKSEKIGKADWIIFSILILISGVSAYFTYQGILSMLSVVATVGYMVSIWQKNIKVYKTMGIFISVVWIIYYVFIKSWVSIGFEGVLLITEIIGTIRAFSKPKEEVAKTENKEETLEENS